MSDDIFVTKQINLGALLDYSGIQMIDYRESDGLVEFVFEQPDECQTLRSKLRTGRIEVDLRGYLDAQNRIWSIVRELREG